MAARLSSFGRVLVNDRAPTMAEYETILGKPVEELEPLIEELVERGGADRSRAGVISSRRMLRTQEEVRVGT